MNAADQPFQFSTASYLTRVGAEKSLNISELQAGLEKCSDASIFYHTFHSMGRHHFLTEGFSNDFAQWALSACNQPGLAEALAGLDVRDYLSIADLRKDLRRIVEEFCSAHTQESQQAAFEPFHFEEAIEVTVPLGIEARTLEEFRTGIRRLSHASLYFHFISSRLRLHLRTNDFSLWLADGLGMNSLGQQLEQIDIYTNTLEGVREKMLAITERS
ncbi:MAG TPA: DUF5752 family protein [Terriglobia bacterium]|nr:DUF5752 family protein [Terriglobia bacterium]